MINHKENQIATGAPPLSHFSTRTPPVTPPDSLTSAKLQQVAAAADAALPCQLFGARRRSFLPDNFLEFYTD
ncbi:unnamed protein product [Callosobruchus maculatus]|uniref:Uncharacterized protein n=1 Tax=Callosobruchus maculatus TaxID=64391 RepID=A0A653BKW0_CALMS|nr:unnamed protein product [Callosobruchus maculatus]